MNLQHLPRLAPRTVIRVQNECHTWLLVQLFILNLNKFEIKTKRYHYIKTFADIFRK